MSRQRFQKGHMTLCMPSFELFFWHCTLQYRATLQFLQHMSEQFERVLKQFFHIASGLVLESGATLQLDHS